MGTKVNTSTSFGWVTLAAVLLAGGVALFKGLDPLGRVTFFLYFEGTGLLLLALLGRVVQVATEPADLETLLLKPSRELVNGVLSQKVFYLGFLCLVAGDLVSLV